MKRLTSALFLAASPVVAEEPTKDEICQLMGNLAQIVMENRQNGIPLSQAMGIAQPGAYQDLIRQMVIDAYEAPRWQTQVTKIEAAQDFRNDTELACFSNLKG